MTADPARAEARYGWESDFPRFRRTEARIIRSRLEDFIRDAGDAQIRAWNTAIPTLQHEVGEVIDRDPGAAGYTAILEYELPMEARRSDVVLLVRGPVIVLELKGKELPSQADVDQASAYARDLQCYHAACEGRKVVPIVVPMRAKGRLPACCGVEVMGPDAVDGAVHELTSGAAEPAIAAVDFSQNGPTARSRPWWRPRVSCCCAVISGESTRPRPKPTRPSTR